VAASVGEGELALLRSFACASQLVVLGRKVFGEWWWWCRWVVWFASEVGWMRRRDGWYGSEILREDCGI
jgi:hypothetical protein